MFRNYLKIALRNLGKQRGYAFITVAGLAAGMACCLLILLYVQDELSYERIHEQADRLYRVTSELHLGAQELQLASTMAPLGPAMADAFPDVAQAARVGLLKNKVLVRRGEQAFYEEAFFFADSTVFSVFTLPLVRGDVRAALHAPDAVVISETMAQKYFGDADPLGQVLTVEGRHDLRVTAVMRDVPPQTHFRPSMLASLDAAGTVAGARLDQWGELSKLYTYVVLPPGRAAALEARLPAFLDRQASDISTSDAPPSTFVKLHLQPVRDIHLRSGDLRNEIGPTSDERYVFVFGSIALLVLVIACINFMNLATARSAGRAKEVGVRKVMGANRAQLVRQFLGESLLLALVALLVALALVELLLPLFNELSGKSLRTDYTRNPVLLGALAGVTLFVGLVAGSYPALFLSAFRPAEVLKGKARRSASARLRQVLVVVQFGISIVLMIGAVVMSAQMEYFRSKDLGFDQEQVVVLPLQDADVRRRHEALKELLAAQPGVVRAAASTATPGKNSAGLSAFLPEGGAGQETVSLYTFMVDDDLIETLGIRLVEGRGFSRAVATDTAGAYVLNRSAVRRLGWEQAVGKTLKDINHDAPGRVIGVVDDFHLFSLESEVPPLLMAFRPSAFDHLVLRIRPADVPATLAGLEEAWKTFAPGVPFAYSFVDQDFEQQYADTARLSRTLHAFTFLALLIACLGLFGLAAYTAEQRTKEIGVRKVMGATVPGLVVLLSREFVRLVLVAFVLAAPAAYLLASRWLEEFAYRVPLSWPIFALAGAAALVIALATVSYQAVRAALADPVESLRYE